MIIKEYTNGKWFLKQQNFKTANEALHNALDMVQSREAEELANQLAIIKDGEFCGYKELSEEEAAFEYARLYGGERKIIF